MKILVIHGPNLNVLGKRSKRHYGNATLEEINGELQAIAKKKGITLVIFQSNHEGELIDFVQKQKDADGILINPAALTHYGIALRDALEDSGLPIVEVHMSDIKNREIFRRVDVLDGMVLEKIIGQKEKSYFIGLKKLIDYLSRKI